MNQLYIFLGYKQTKKDLESGIPPTLTKFYSIEHSQEAALCKVLIDSNVIKDSNKFLGITELSKDWN